MLWVQKLFRHPPDAKVTSMIHGCEVLKYLMDAMDWQVENSMSNYHIQIIHTSKPRLLFTDYGFLRNHTTCQLKACNSFGGGLIMPCHSSLGVEIQNNLARNGGSEPCESNDPVCTELCSTEQSLSHMFHVNHSVHATREWTSTTWSMVVKEAREAQADDINHFSNL